MLRFQSELPHLPVPALTDTCAHYLELVRPLLSEREHTATQRAAAEFARPGGSGEELQSRLLKWSEVRDNWLEPFWDNWYLCDDTPLVVNVSPGFVLTGGDRPQIERAARLLAAAVRVKGAHRRRGASSRTSTAALPAACASTRASFRRRGSRERLATTSVRTPAAGMSSSFTGIASSRSTCSMPMGARARYRARARASEDRRRPAPGRALARRPHDGRRRSWAGIRERQLVRGPAPTRELLDVVEQAILVLVLEAGSPPPHPRTSGAARLGLHGDARGRWFDKSIQLVVTANGVAGFCMEHSGFDGSTAVRLAELLVEHENAAPPESGAAGELVPRLVSYEPTKRLRDAISSAQHDANALLRRTGSRRARGRRPRQALDRPARSEPGRIRADGVPARVLRTHRRDGVDVRVRRHETLPPRANRGDAVRLRRERRVRACAPWATSAHRSGGAAPRRNRASCRHTRALQGRTGRPTGTCSACAAWSSRTRRRHASSPMRATPP